MTLIDLKLPTPEANLALDEVLLEEAEASRGARETLRFWRSPSYCAVIGSSGRLQQEVYAEACGQDGIPVLRRHSGGGTVLQGPGCLNFSLVLLLETRTELRGIHESFRFILDTIRRGLAVDGLVMRGISDLSIGGRKVSGNAQRRRARALLHHGTILYNFDPEFVGQYLRHPPKEPDYRQGRKHQEFMANLSLSPGTIESRIRAAWGAEPGKYAPPPRLQELTDEKYANPEWTARF